MEGWKPLIRASLGKKLVPKTEKIAWDIHCVSVGVKPGFLFDYGHVTGEEISCLLQSAHSEGLLVNNSLRVITVDTDVVIINPGQLQEYLQSLEEKPSVRFIDVSERLTAPDLLGDESMHKVHPSIVTVKTILQHAIKLDSEDFEHLSAVIPPLANVTTVYGLLLGYPVVYWYELDQGHDFGKCLSMEPLRNIKVWGNGFQSIHNNMPSQGREFCSKGSNSSLTNTLPDSKNTLISSFTFPERFLPELKSGLDSWCQLISAKRDGDFERILHTEEVITQSAVLL